MAGKCRRLIVVLFNNENNLLFFEMLISDLISPNLKI